MYADRQRWYWAVVGSNGRLLALSPAAGFTRRRSAVCAARQLARELVSLPPTFDNPPVIPQRQLPKLDLSLVALLQQ